MRREQKGWADAIARGGSRFTAAGETMKSRGNKGRVDRIEDAAGDLRDEIREGYGKEGRLNW